MQLSVPNRTAPKNGSFNSKAASVKEWIDRLPMANIGATTRLLFEALTDLNYQDIPAQQRFKALELLRKPVEFVTDHMKKHFLGQPLPLADKNLKVARLSREITHSMATGYKVLVMEQLAGIGRSDRKLLITSIHRATKLLGSVLLKAYQVYESYPDSVWLEIHSLYRYAEANGLRVKRNIAGMPTAFTAEYGFIRHHFTLYFYDQANNLVAICDGDAARTLAALGFCVTG